MIKKLNQINLFTKQESLGIDIIVNASGKYSFNIVKLTKIKDEISLTLALNNLSEITEISSHKKHETPVLVNIRGKGVLTKVIDVTDNSSGRSIISQVLPNAKAEDFYIKISNINSSKLLVSVVRKNLVEQIITLLLENNFSIYDIGIGSHCIMNMNNFIPFDDNFSIGEDRFNITEGKIESIAMHSSSDVNNIMTIGSEQVASENLSAFAIAFNYFVMSVDSYSLSEQFAHLRSEFRYKVLFRKVGLASLAGFLIILSFNYMIFMNINKTVQSLNNDLINSNKLLKEVVELENHIKLKEILVNESGFFNSLSHAYMADRLAFLRPDEIKLETLKIRPLVGKFSEDEKCIFGKNLIEVSGYSTHSTFVNKWLENIKKENWVKDVLIKEYNHDSRLNIGHFIIEVKY